MKLIPATPDAMKMVRFTSAAGRGKVNTADTAPTQLPAVRACLVNPDSLLDALVGLSQNTWPQVVTDGSSSSFKHIGQVRRAGAVATT